METVGGAKWALEFARLRDAGMPAMAAIRATYPLREVAREERELRKVIRLVPALREAA